jgi:NAD-dependent SIR2 family protein deacetylase
MPNPSAPEIHNWLRSSCKSCGALWHDDKGRCISVPLHLYDKELRAMRMTGVQCPKCGAIFNPKTVELA